MSNPQIILQSHEDRLQTLEQAVNETMNKVSVVDTHVRHMNDAMARQHAEILNKLTENFSDIHARLVPMENKLSVVTQSISEHEDRLERIRISDANKAKRNKKIRNVLIGLSVTAATGLAAKGGDLLWKMLIETKLIVP